VRAGAAALREALLLHVEWFGGASHHRDDCPGGGCEEHKVLAVVEDALADPTGRDELERRQRAEARVVALERDWDRLLAEKVQLRAEVDRLKEITLNHLREASAALKAYEEPGR
jgi:hypothetical protein